VQLEIAEDQDRIELKTPMGAAFEIRDLITRQRHSLLFVVVCIEEWVEELSFVLQVLMHGNGSHIGVVTTSTDLEDAISVVFSPDAMLTNITLVKNHTIWSSFPSKQKSAVEIAPLGFVYLGNPRFFFTEVLSQQSIVINPALRVEDTGEFRIFVSTIVHNTIFEESLLSQFNGFIFRTSGLVLDPSFISLVATGLRKKCSAVVLIMPDLPDFKKMSLEKDGFLISGYEHLSDQQASLLLKLSLANQKL